MSSSICFRALKGWLAGCGAATAVISAVTFPMLALRPGGGISPTGLDVLGLLTLTVVIFIFTGLLTGIPAVLVIWLSEKFRIASVLFFGCIGSAIGALSGVILLGPSPTVMTGLFLAAGFVAGMAYWRIAGRYAGQDREVSRNLT